MLKIYITIKFKIITNIIKWVYYFYKITSNSLTKIINNTTLNTNNFIIKLWWNIYLIIIYIISSNKFYPITRSIIIWNNSLCWTYWNIILLYIFNSNINKSSWILYSRSWWWWFSTLPIICITLIWFICGLTNPT